MRFAEEENGEGEIQFWDNCTNHTWMSASELQQTSMMGHLGWPTEHVAISSAVAQQMLAYGGFKLHPITLTICSCGEIGCGSLQGLVTSVTVPNGITLPEEIHVGSPALLITHVGANGRMKAVDAPDLLLVGTDGIWEAPELDFSSEDNNEAFAQAPAIDPISDAHLGAARRCQYWPTLLSARWEGQDLVLPGERRLSSLSPETVGLPWGGIRLQTPDSEQIIQTQEAQQLLVNLMTSQGRGEVDQYQGLPTWAREAISARR